MDLRAFGWSPIDATDTTHIGRPVPLMRTFSLSFSDPETAEHLGVCVIDVDEADVEATPRPPRAPDAAWATPVVPWMAAAIRLSWIYGCNPGGACAATEIPYASDVPRGQLLTGAAPGPPGPPIH